MDARNSWAILFGSALVLAGCFGSGGNNGEGRAGNPPGPISPPPPGSATLSWYPPTQNVGGSALTNLAGYRIYYGSVANALNQRIELDNPGLTRFVVEDLSPARWHFAMTAVNSRGVESKRSTTVSKTIG